MLIVFFKINEVVEKIEPFVSLSLFPCLFDTMTSKKSIVSLLKNTFNVYANHKMIDRLYG